MPSRAFRLGFLWGFLSFAQLGCATPPPPVPAPPVVVDNQPNPKPIPRPTPAGAVSREALAALTGKGELEVEKVLGKPYDAYTQPRAPFHRVVSFRIVLAGDGPRFAHVHFTGGKALPIDPR
jgi:hypothetical protein